MLHQHGQIFMPPIPVQAKIQLITEFEHGLCMLETNQSSPLGVTQPSAGFESLPVVSVVTMHKRKEMPCVLQNWTS